MSREDETPGSTVSAVAPERHRDGEADLPALHRRLLRVFVSPGEVFDALARRPAWVGALLLGAALVTVGTLVLPEELFLEMMREQVEARGDAVEGVPSAETMALIARVSGGIFAAIGWTLMMALWAGASTLVFGLLLGDEGRFVHYFSVTCHAFLIAAVGALLLAPLKIAAGDITLTLSVGTFFEGFLEGGYAARLLNGLDLFGLWALLVLGVGISRLDRGRSWASATAVLVVLWIGVAAGFALFSFGQGA